MGLKPTLECCKQLQIIIQEYRGGKHEKIPHQQIDAISSYSHHPSLLAESMCDSANSSAAYKTENLCSLSDKELPLSVTTAASKPATKKWKLV